jgi:toxin ParE1/3/4
MKPHGFHREALEEYVQAAEYYAKISPELGGRFHEEIERLIGDVCRAPSLFRRVHGPIRRHFSPTFPFATLYEDRTDHVSNVAVMAMQRDPDYWTPRTH